MYRVERDHAPFVFQRVEKALTLEDVPLMEQHIQWVHTQPRVFSVVDARGIERPDSTVRSALAEMLKRNDNQGSPARATVIIFSSRLVAGALTALRWVVPAKTPEGHVSSGAEALAFLEEHARKEGVAVPPGFRARLERADAEAKGIAG